MDFKTLTVAISDSVATITLNRPELRNAFNEDAIEELAVAFEGLGQSDTVRAIVLAANGPAFCAGADLNWMKQMAAYSDDENQQDAMRLANMLRTIYRCPKPTVARVQGDCYAGGMGLVAACDIVVASEGDCYAGGMGLVAACDIVVASEGANFCLSEVKLGLIPATISPYVIKAMGEQAARRYFLTAERFDANEAYRIGFAHEVVAPEALDAQVAAIVKALVTNSPNAVKQAKQLVRDVVGQDVSDTLLANTAGRIADIRASNEGREGVASFLEKRKPTWLI